MSEETGNQTSFDQVEELWKQWYETSFKAWSDVLAGADPQAMTTRWLQVMEETRLKLLNGAGVPADPFNLFKQWYESSNEVWSKTIGEIIGTEKFVEQASHSLESYLSFYKTFRRLNEEYFSQLQLTTRADLARVAEMIIALENKVDWIQDAFEDFQGQFPQFATLEATAMLTTQLANLEGKLQNLPEALQKIDTLEDLSHRLGAIEGTLQEIRSASQKIDALQGLGQRLSSLEEKVSALPGALLEDFSHRLGAIEGTLQEIRSASQKIDALQELDLRLSSIEEKVSALPGALEKINATDSLEKRLDGVENKLDRLLTLLEQSETRQQTTITTPAKTTQRRASRAKSQKTAESEGITS